MHAKRIPNETFGGSSEVDIMMICFPFCLKGRGKAKNCAVSAGAKKVNMEHDDFLLSSLIKSQFYR